MATNKMTIAEIRKTIRGLDWSVDYHREDMVRAVRDITHRDWLRASFMRRINEVQALVIPARFAPDSSFASETLERAFREVAALDAMA